MNKLWKYHFPCSKKTPILTLHNRKVHQEKKGQEDVWFIRISVVYAGSIYVRLGLENGDVESVKHFSDCLWMEDMQPFNLYEVMYRYDTKSLYSPSAWLQGIVHMEGQMHSTGGIYPLNLSTELSMNQGREI